MSVRRYDTIGLGLLKNKKKKKKKKKEECQNRDFYFARCVRKLRYYGDVIDSFDWKSAVEHDGAV